MKILNDYFSILCFFIAWLITKSIYQATAVGMISSLLQVVFLAIKYRQFKPIQWVVLTFVFWLIFGSLTLIFHNQRFIQWKPSILYWCFGLAFFISHFWKGDNLYKKLLKAKVELAEPIWSKMNMSWVYFFIIMGILNLVVVYHFSLKTWIYYKIFGTIALTLVFAIAQAFYLNKHMQSKQAEDAPKNG